MRKFLKFVHDEMVYILFHTGMRISEFCGLTLKDIDLEHRIVNSDHQLQRTSDMRYIIETTKTDAVTRVLPITEDVAQMFQAIIEDRNAPKVEKTINGYSGFLFYDDNGMPLVAMHWQHRFNHMVTRKCRSSRKRPHRRKLLPQRKRGSSLCRQQRKSRH